MASLTKDKMLFDPADLSDSDNVGAYVRAGSDGDLISSTNVGGSEGLDVNIINASVDVNITNASIAVTATDLDIRNLVFATDKVDVSGSSVTATATDLDIRDLSHTQDSVKVGDGVDFLAINADGSLNVNMTDDSIADDAADSGNPFKVGGKAYSSLSADPVDNGDRANLAMDIYRRIYIHDAPNMASLQQKITVGTSAVALPTSALAGRTRIQIQNVSNSDIYVGSATVTTSGATQGLKVSKGATESLEAGANCPIFAIAGGAGNDVVVLELA